MLTVSQAIDEILREIAPLDSVAVPLADAYGLVSADAILSEVDSPPFDKAMMDGFAVRAVDLRDPETRLQILEHVIAGRLPTKTVAAGQATRIMTGAPLPAGADAVVRIEDCRIDADGRSVVVDIPRVPPGQFIIPRGNSLKVGQSVLPSGRKLGPQELGALAEVGRATVSVHPRPTVGVLATGDELIPIDRRPGPGQIRNSNEVMLCAQVRRAGGTPIALGIATDDESDLRERILAARGCHVLLLSGGVSEGTHDLVPSVLELLGVRKVFHKINIRPGKPLWFGNWASQGRIGEGRGTAVFGLPGNPVSSLVCFEVFVRTSLRRLMGDEPAAPRIVQARLAREHVARGDRPTYNPARLRATPTGWDVEPVRWLGSSDLQSTTHANAVAIFPGGDTTYSAGQLTDVIPFD